MLLLLQIEGEISKRYKNRRVNIMGEINTIWVWSDGDDLDGTVYHSACRISAVYMRQVQSECWYTGGGAELTSRI